MTDEDKVLYLSAREPEMDVVSPQPNPLPINYFNHGIDIQECIKRSAKLPPKQVWLITKKEPEKTPAVELVRIKPNKTKGRKIPKPWKSNWSESEVSTLIEMRELNMPWYMISGLLKRSQNSLKGKYHIIRNDRKKEKQGVPLLP